MTIADVIAEHYWSLYLLACIVLVVVLLAVFTWGGKS